MKYRRCKQVQLHDLDPNQDCFREKVLNGLRKSPKQLSCKYFYDEQGSRLFERICTLDEYYIPHIETAIMKAYVDEIVELLGQRVLLIEYGSGDCAKTHILLEHLCDLVTYVPIDISRAQLLRVTKELAANYHGLEVLPICADYTSKIELPVPRKLNTRKVVYFPGSTIGNFDPIPARNFLAHIARICGPNGGLLIGVDLKKDPRVLHRAYNDSQGVTAAFNLNLLKRINRELNGNFDLDWFEHYAFYNPHEGRIEMHLISLRKQTVHLDKVAIPFAKGESIWTESSYKYNLDEFEQIASAAGFKVEHVWTDEKQWFSIQYLVSQE